MAGILDTLIGRFDKLYRRKAHMHHFCQYVDASVLARAREALVEVRDACVLWSDRGTSARTTNNRMELRAMIGALKRVPEGGEAVLYSDSNLCVRTLNEWAEGWEAKGWVRAKGEPVMNADLVREALALRRARPAVRIRWIRAHDGATWNEYADRLASWRDGGKRR